VPKEVRKESVLRRSSSGSGFLVSSGQIVTNSHFVEKCEKVIVKTPIGDATGTLLNRDPQLDLALIKVDQKLGEPMPRLKSVLLGEEVMTAGYPYEGLLSKSLKVTFGGNHPLEPQAREVEFFPMEEVLHEEVKIHRQPDHGRAQAR